MNKTISLILLLSLIVNVLFSQDAEELDSILVTANRIDIPFKESSRTIKVITASEIQQSAATNVSELLQQVAGIDIRRRGTAGMQSDLYIRGGGFDQTLILIDGIKVEDPQTGHHTMNMILPLDVIKRIEIIKGPAARVFGQNAFTGAVNIVTKTNLEGNTLGYQLGSYNQQNVSGTLGKDFNKTSVIAHASINTSDGYRYNTDFKNQNYFIKSSFNKINLIGVFTERKFGANGFYASPSAINQYEETQSSLLGLTSEFKTDKFTFKPRVYWKRNQDVYLFVRHNPSVYRNLHISNKVGAEINTSYKSKIGTTGFGVDLAKVYLSSNNLGDRDRFMANMFLEHRFKLLNDKLDITPGLSINYLSDFKFHAFPGIDLGYQINDKLKVYANAGYTYRIPTYTDLYYSDPDTLGNENLEPEEAFAEEIGLKFTKGSLSTSIAFFNRNTNNMIDYIREEVDGIEQATNIQDLNSFGFEANADYTYSAFGFNQNLSFGYTYLDEDLEKLEGLFSRYSINSLKHHITATYRSQFLENIRQSIVYKFAERTTGDTYFVFDVMATLDLESLEISVIGNNIFNVDYTETNLVPMPKGNVLVDLKYKF